MDVFLNYVFLRNPVKAWLLALAFVFGGYIAGKIFSGVTSRIARILSKRPRGRIAGIVADLAGKPLVLLMLIAGIFIGLKQLTMSETATLWTYRIYNSLLILIISWTIDKCITAILVEFIPIRNPDPAFTSEIEIQPILKKLVKTLVWVIAFVLILRVFGYNASALLAGLGLGGAALALASKDTLASFFGSITVFLDRSFKLNDRIKISGYDGYITEMGLRTSRIRTLENRTIIIPNSMFTSTPIENISSEPHTKVTQTVSVSRDCGREGLVRAVELLKDICLDCDGTDGRPEAGVTSVSGGAFQIQFIFYVAKEAGYLDTVNRVNLEVLRRFEEAGIILN